MDSDINLKTAENSNRKVKLSKTLKKPRKSLNPNLTNTLNSHKIINADISTIQKNAEGASR